MKHAAGSVHASSRRLFWLAPEVRCVARAVRYVALLPHTVSKGHPPHGRPSGITPCLRDRIDKRHRQEVSTRGVDQERSYLRPATPEWSARSGRSR